MIHYRSHSARAHPPFFTNTTLLSQTPLNITLAFVFQDDTLIHLNLGLPPPRNRHHQGFFTTSQSPLLARNHHFSCLRPARLSCLRYPRSCFVFDRMHRETVLFLLDECDFWFENRRIRNWWETRGRAEERRSWPSWLVGVSLPFYRLRNVEKHVHRD